MAEKNMTSQVIVSPQPQMMRLRGFSLRRAVDSGPEYVEIRIKKGDNELARIWLGKGDAKTWEGLEIWLQQNETVILECNMLAIIYVDHVWLDSMDTIHMWACGVASFQIAGEPPEEELPPKQKSRAQLMLEEMEK